MSSVAPDAVEYCGHDFCERHRDAIDQACHDLNLPPGRWVMMQQPGGAYCYCVCGSAARAELHNAIAIAYRLHGAPRAMVLASARPVLVFDGNALCPAGRLRLTDRLCDAARRPVEIEDLRLGHFVGPHLDEPVVREADRLIVRGGVLVGDLVSELLPEGRADERAEVGSPAWRAAIGRAAPPTPEPAVEIAGGVFTPASAYRVTIPQHASD